MSADLDDLGPILGKRMNLSSTRRTGLPQRTQQTIYRESIDRLAILQFHSYKVASAMNIENNFTEQVFISARRIFLEIARESHRIALDEINEVR